MERKRRSDRYQSQEYLPEREAICRPALLNIPVGYYCGRHSRIPEKVRVSFSDGTTAVYRLEVELPEPMFRDWQNEAVIVGYKWKGEDA